MPVRVKKPMVPKCGYCHRENGSHSAGCKKTTCRFCAKLEPKKCRFHGGGRSDQLRQKKVKVRLSGRITPADLYYVTKLKAAIAEHERKAAALREALEILEK